MTAEDEYYELVDRLPPGAMREAFWAWNSDLRELATSLLHTYFNGSQSLQRMMIAFYDSRPEALEGLATAREFDLG